MSALDDSEILHTLGAGVHIANRYVIRRVLGKGGMGHVFEVENRAIGRRFALKILALPSATGESLKRFRREALALGRVTSSRVAQVVDFDVDPDVGPFLVMELLDGETLQQRLNRVGRTRVAEMIPLAIELCEALADVHSAGIIHRDLKPSNIGVSTNATDCRVKLLDFGLAASVDDAFSERLTQSQQFLGTLPYMAPEQFHGRPPSMALDLYSLGVVMFELLAGRTPFVASTPAAFVAHHLTSPIPSLDSIVPGHGAPPWLEAIIRKLLAKEPEHRFASAGAVARALRNENSGAMDTTEPNVEVVLPSGPTWKSRVLATLQPASAWRWIALVMLVGVGAILWQQRRNANPAVQATAQPPTRTVSSATADQSFTTPRILASPPSAETSHLGEPMVATSHRPQRAKPKRVPIKKNKWNGEVLDE